MKKGLGLKTFVYLLCSSFLWMMNTCPVLAMESGTLPVGEMFSKGEVTFETGKNVWKKVESSYFPVLPGTKVKTGKGVATIQLSDNSRIAVDANSLFAFDRYDQFVLSQGSIEFHLLPTSELKIQAGKVSIMKARALQAGRNLSVSPLENQPIMGTVSVHPNGSVTVKSIEGKLSILNEENVVLADLSQKDAITIPAKADVRTQVAQSFEPASGTAGKAAPGTEPEGFMGLSTWTWVGIGAAAVAVGVGAGVAGSGGGSSHSAVCP